jgi:hypothetical protein
MAVRQRFSTQKLLDIITEILEEMLVLFKSYYFK